jgi:hypothetical protein
MSVVRRVPLAPARRGAGRARARRRFSRSRYTASGKATTRIAPPAANAATVTAAPTAKTTSIARSRRRYARSRRWWVFIRSREG